MESATFKTNAKNILVSGHRGGMLDYENSLACFKLAIENGFKEIEFDIWLTSDKVPIVYHGVKGTVGLDESSQGLSKEEKIKELTLKQIKSYKLPNGEEIPTFEELLELCAGKIVLNVEIKDPEKEVCQIVMDLLIQYE
mmetsp:Transcript_31985/g.28347  ORF Transcript_31985/g.28347 Transcript_31985/m.28347 type:complete len:139 (+) Transcript_31985:13-429(+)